MSCTFLTHRESDHPEIIKRGLWHDRRRVHIKLKASVTGYMLRQLIADRLPSHSLKSSEYRRCLKNNPALYGKFSAILAPGYKVSL